MAHFNDQDRKRLEFLKASGFPDREIANDLGKHKSSVLRELMNRSIDSDRGYGCSNRICARYDECPRVKGYGRDASRSFRCTPRCFEVCPDFVERTCEKLLVPSHVCNGCGQFPHCPMRKRIYSADGAQANYEGILHESRSGVHPSGERIAAMNRVISPCVIRGQSVRNVIANNAEVFDGIKERTVYDYIAGGLFDIGRGDLPEACSRRPIKKKKETKTNAKCRVGRTYREFVVYCQENGIGEWAELDTVIGRVGGKVLFTVYLPGGVMLAFLRDARTSQTCTRMFNDLWELAGPELFRRLFRVVLTDNGPEFSDPEMIECYRPDPEHNSTKIVPRGIRLFYCDPYCSPQKPHVNSYSRGVLGGGTAYDTFVERFGEEGKAFLDRLGVVKVEPNEVTLDPILLGEKFKRHADRVILRKAGVIATKQPTYVAKK